MTVTTLCVFKITTLTQTLWGKPERVFKITTLTQTLWGEPERVAIVDQCQAHSRPGYLC